MHDTLLLSSALKLEYVEEWHAVTSLLLRVAQVFQISLQKGSRLTTSFREASLPSATRDHLGIHAVRSSCSICNACIAFELQAARQASRWHGTSLKACAELPIIIMSIVAMRRRQKQKNVGQQAFVAAAFVRPCPIPRRRSWAAACYLVARSSTSALQVPCLADMTCVAISCVVFFL